MNFMYLIKLVSFYLIMFFLLYLEPVSIGPVKFGYLWKAPIILFLIIYVLKIYHKSRQVPSYVLYGFMLSFKKFLTLSSFKFIISAVIDFFQTIIFYLFLYTFSKLFNKEQLHFLGKHTAILVVLSFIPFILGILEPLGEKSDLKAYGYENINTLVGMFQNPHSASIIIAFSIIIIFYYFTNSNRKKERFFLLSLLVLAVYEIYDVFVRTGWAMIIAVIVYNFIKNKKLSYYLKYIPILLLGIIIFYFIYLNNEILQMRMEGTNKYQQEAMIGSGRGMFSQYALQHWYENGFESIFIGLGMEHAKDLMYLDTGLRVFAHDGFIETLQSEGLIGFTLFLMVLYSLFRLIRKNRSSKFYAINMNIFIAYIVEIALQGGNYFFVYMLIAVFISLVKIETKEVSRI